MKDKSEEHSWVCAPRFTYGNGRPRRPQVDSPFGSHTIYPGGSLGPGGSGTGPPM